MIAAKSIHICHEPVFIQSLCLHCLQLHSKMQHWRRQKMIVIHCNYWYWCQCWKGHNNIYIDVDVILSATYYTVTLIKLALAEEHVFRFCGKPVKSKPYCYKVERNISCVLGFGHPTPTPPSPAVLLPLNKYFSWKHILGVFKRCVWFKRIRYKFYFLS